MGGPGSNRHILPFSLREEFQDHLRICGLHPEISFHVQAEGKMALCQEIVASHLDHDVMIIELLDDVPLKDIPDTKEGRISLDGRFQLDQS